uniref:Flavin-containing monooxygenase n=1 Tax=Acrobeloides nanus TaxID=290746 RepID=A0A914DFC5_9BILA
MVEKKRVAIIGAGASGLPSLRHALLYGVEPVLFEASDWVGGLWRYKSYDTEESSVMKTTVINTSKEMSAYSDFPPPAEFANFMHNTQMLKYLELYATQFDMLKYIKFNHRIVNVERAKSYNKDGKWIVTYTDDQGQKQQEEFDGVLLATGHHAKPYYPEKWHGQDSFKGKIIHSHDYKSSKGYDDKVVVVVGIGNSGGDVAVELAKICKQVYLSTRRGAWIVHRIFDYGEPIDMALSSRIQTLQNDLLPLSVKNWIAEKLLQKKFDHAKYGLKPKHGFYGQHPTVNDDLPNRIANGTVLIVPNIKAFTENGVIFEDGTRIENVDEVILSTGYSFDFPLLEDGTLVPVKDNEVSLYKYVFPPDLSDHNSLGIIGLIQPLGSIMTAAEMQARLFFDVFAGNTKLPSKSEMLAEIKAKKDYLANRYVHSRRHTIQIDIVPYLDELALLMGAYPHLKDYIFSDPVLAYHILFGPGTAYKYRLNGPKPWDGARDAILTTQYRVDKGFNPFKKEYAFSKEKKSATGWNKWKNR